MANWTVPTRRGAGRDGAGSPLPDKEEKVARAAAKERWPVDSAEDAGGGGGRARVGGVEEGRLSLVTEAGRGGGRVRVNWVGMDEDRVESAIRARGPSVL